MSIECMRYKPINKGTLLGYVDLYIPKMGLEIYGCSFHQKDGRRWINFPSKEYTDEQGEKKYSATVRFREKSQMEDFSRVAKEAIEKKCAEQSHCYQPDFLHEELPF